MDKVVAIFLRKLGINIPDDEVSFQIRSHPSYPSLHAITGVLSHFNVENLALQVPIDVETLKELPDYFIAMVKSGNSEHFTVVGKKSGQYELIGASKKKELLSVDEFLDRFTGILVAAESDDMKGVPNVKGGFLSNYKMFLLLSAISMLLLWMSAKPVFWSFIFLAATIIGFVVSFSIFKQEQGESTGIGEAFCSGDTERTDCNKVINSKGANFFGLFKLSDLSIVYFLGLFILLFFVVVANYNMIIPYSIALLSVTITLYSIYYQAFVVKSWCGLCLTIVGVLWIQAAIAILQFENYLPISFHIHDLFLVLFSFSLAFVFWFYYKTNYEQIKQLKEDKIKYFKFKHNFNIFKTLLEHNNKIRTSITDLPEIIFGNKEENSLSITIVTNPFCGHCRAVHSLVEKIVDKYRDFVNITIRFNINIADKEEDLVNIVSRLLEIYHTDGADKAMDAMHDIYGGQIPEKWFEKWGKCINVDEYYGILEKESAWCKEHDINFTPAIFIEGYSYPKEYDRGDLEYFIEDLYEIFIEKEITPV